jgi:hypothetical protein
MTIFYIKILLKAIFKTVLEALIRALICLNTYIGPKLSYKLSAINTLQRSRNSKHLWMRGLRSKSFGSVAADTSRMS